MNESQLSWVENQAVIALQASTYKDCAFDMSFPRLRAYSPAHNGFLRFTSGATPAFSTNMEKAGVVTLDYCAGNKTPVA